MNSPWSVPKDMLPVIKLPGKPASKKKKEAKK